MAVVQISSSGKLHTSISTRPTAAGVAGLQQMIAPGTRRQMINLLHSNSALAINLLARYDKIVPA